MERREFIKTAGAGAIAAGALIAGAPAVHAQKTIEITMVTTWPRDFPGLGTGAQRFAKRLTDMTNGRMKVNYFAAGERVKAFDSFDDAHKTIVTPAATIGLAGCAIQRDL